MPRVRSLHVGVSVASIAATLWFVFVFLAPSRPPMPRVEYPDFAAELETGRIDSITIHDDVLTFRVHGGESKQTVSRVASVAQVRALRPSNPELAPPRIQFER